MPQALIQYGVSQRNVTTSHYDYVRNFKKETQNRSIILLEHFQSMKEVSKRLTHPESIKKNLKSFEWKISWKKNTSARACGRYAITYFFLLYKS